MTVIFHNINCVNIEPIFVMLDEIDVLTAAALALYGLHQ